MNNLILLILLPLLVAVGPISCVSEPPIAVTVTKNLIYATGLKRGEPVEWMLDRYAPTEPGDWPIVLFLHDFGQTKEGAAQLPQAIAEQGVIVFNIDYPHIDPTVAILKNGNGHRILDEIVACAVRFARDSASDLGSSTAPVAIAGFAYGGGVGSHVALMGENVNLLWEEYATSLDGPPCQCDCKVTEGSTRVDALVGIAGAYDAFVGYDGRFGREFMQEKDPELWQVLHSSIGENPDLKVRLLHSQADSDIPYANSVEFESVLAEAGYDVQLIPFSGGHSVPQELTVQTIMDVFKE